MAVDKGNGKDATFDSRWYGIGSGPLTGNYNIRAFEWNHALLPVSTMLNLVISKMNPPIIMQRDLEKNAEKLFPEKHGSRSTTSSRLQGRCRHAKR